MTTELPPAPPRPPDRPVVARPRFTRGAIVFAVLSTVIVVGYTAIVFTGTEPSSPSRDEIPQTVRSRTGGYRTYLFWHAGYHGGK